jgi:hypothetical protein
MESTKVSKLLLSWLWSQGHQIVTYDEGKGIATKYGREEYRFDLDGSFGGYRVVYNRGAFSFYDGDKLLKETNLYELS